MSNDILNKKLAGCIIKGALLAEEHRQKHGTLPEPFPVHCKYASANKDTNEPYCEQSRKIITDMILCPLTKPAIKRPVKKRVPLPPLTGKGITWIFMKTRNTYHISLRGRQAYCRGTFDIMGIFHVDNMPVSCICRHCVKAWRVEQAKIAADSARHGPCKPESAP